MATDQLLSPGLISPPPADTKRRLAELLEPGRRRLEASGVLSAAATAATAAGFFAVAAIA